MLRGEPQTAYEHSWEIRRRFGYHEFEDRAWGRKFRTFLYGRAWTYPEGPVALFNHRHSGQALSGGRGLAWA